MVVMIMTSTCTLCRHDGGERQSDENGNMLNRKLHFSHLRLLAVYMRKERYWGDIKICYNFISIQLIHKNHMFNITVPALFPYPSSPSTPFHEHGNLYLLFLFNRQKRKT